jgi:hypothetical protein
MPKAVPPKEVPIAGATVLPAGQLFVIKDTNKVVVNPIAQTAAALLASVGGTTLTTCSVADRWGAFPDTGLRGEAVWNTSNLAVHLTRIGLMQSSEAGRFSPRSSLIGVNVPPPTAAEDQWPFLRA